MSSKTKAIFAVLVAACLTPAMSFPVAHAVTGLDTEQPIELAGEVVSFIAGPGLQQPTIILDVEGTWVTVRLGPNWYLRDQEFTAAEGDQVEATAYTCDACTADYVAASVYNVSTGALIELRDADGVPLWPDLKHAVSVLLDLSTVDPSTAIEVTGVVADFIASAGEGTPILVLEVDGELLSIVVSPYRVWRDAGFLPEVGQTLLVRYVEVHKDEEVVLLALSATDPDTGMTVVLRDPDTGKPLGGPYSRRNLRRAIDAAGQTRR